MPSSRVTTPNFNLLKLIAIISMTVDHIHWICFDLMWHPHYYTHSWHPVYLFGRLALPLFCFLLAYHYHYNTRDKRQYIRRLLLFAFISQVPYQWALGFPFDEFPRLNIFFTLSGGLLLVALIEKWRAYNSQVIFCVITFASISYIYYSGNNLSWMNDGGIVGILLVPAIYILCHSHVIGWFIILGISIVLYEQNWWLGLMTIAFASLSFVVPFRLHFMQRHKLFFYAFYPVHLVLIKLFFIKAWTPDTSPSSRTILHFSGSRPI